MSTNKEISDSSNRVAVTLVTYNIHNLGGIPRSTTTIANGLAAAGYRVTIASIAPGTVPMHHPLSESIQLFTCNKVIPHRQKLTSTTIGRFVRKFAARVFYRWKPKNLQWVRPTASGVERLKEHIQGLPPESSYIIVTDVNSMDYVNEVYDDLNEAGPPIIGQFKGAVAALSPSRLQRVIETYKNVDLLLGLTAEDRDLLREKAGIPTGYIHNPIPQADEDVIRMPKDNHFVMMGRLSTEKNHIAAVRAMKLISDRLPEWQLHIYGDGPLRKKLDDEVERLNLDDVVLMRGKTERPLEKLRRAEVHVLSSKHEGFGLVIAEAARVKTPTIAFDSSPGIRLQVTDAQNGLLVEPGNIEALADAMYYLASDAEKRKLLGEAAFVGSQRFDVKEIIRQWQEHLADARVHWKGKLYGDYTDPS